VQESDDVFVSYLVVRCVFWLRRGVESDVVPEHASYTTREISETDAVEVVPELLSRRMGREMTFRFPGSRSSMVGVCDGGEAGLSCCVYSYHQCHSIFEIVQRQWCPDVFALKLKASHLD
jgi:hypothetical protein